MTLPWIYECATAAAIGWFAWQGNPWLIPLSAGVPVLAFLQPTRWQAFTIAFAYYAAASWPIISAALSYFDPAPPTWQSTIYWLTPSLLLTLPWTACWTDIRRNIWYRVPLAFALSILPPIGIIGWASPLSAAGLLFPGWSWFGLALLIGLTAYAVLHRLAAGAVALVCALVANLTWPGQSGPPTDWEGVHSELGRMTDPADPAPEFQASETFQRLARQSTKRAIVFPEFIVANWTEATEAYWQSTITQARATGKTLVVGAGLDHRNAILVRGATTAAPFFQRIPVPIIMWNPLTPMASMPITPFGAGTLEIAGHRAAILVCYEQLLPWLILKSATERPALILAISNDHWVKHTSIPAVKASTLTAWSRLFRLPVIQATNR
ncbi:MAG: hypothetical protein R2729_26095 [Bryobacteraceae bacterium]